MAATHTSSIADVSLRGTRIAHLLDMTTIESPAVDSWRELIRAEYTELPGLRLTKSQVQRLCGLDQLTCDVVLAVLENEKFLRRTPDDTYARVGVDL